MTERQREWEGEVEVWVRGGQSEQALACGCKSSVAHGMVERRVVTLLHRDTDLSPHTVATVPDTHACRECCVCPSSHGYWGTDEKVFAANTTPRACGPPHYSHCSTLSLTLNFCPSHSFSHSLITR